MSAQVCKTRGTHSAFKIIAHPVVQPGLPGPGGQHEHGRVIGDMFMQLLKKAVV